jgi:hypothetical protein
VRRTWPRAHAERCRLTVRTTNVRGLIAALAVTGAPAQSRGLACSDHATFPFANPIRNSPYRLRKWKHAKPVPLNVLNSYLRYITPKILNMARVLNKTEVRNRRARHLGQVVMGEHVGGFSAPSAASSSRPSPAKRVGAHAVGDRITPIVVAGRPACLRTAYPPPASRS